MFSTKKITSRLPILLLALMTLGLITSCGDDVELRSMSFEYTMHNGQSVPTAPYAGVHPNDYTATLKLDEMENGNTMITVTLENTIQGATYNLHAHDSADPSTTPNGTPYNETPNADILAVQIEGTGNTATTSQEASMSYEDLTSSYSGFFVSHDPLQAISTTDIGTYLAVGAFAREQSNPDYESSMFMYDFNTGQVAAAFAYSGSHPTDLSAMIQVDELAENNSRITVRILNSVDGELYPCHAHDMADASTTPNGTPYNETPNSAVFAGGLTGNGGMTSKASISAMSYSDITTTYDGFFVVHDPLQAVSTTDPTTYVILGVFAR